MPSYLASIAYVIIVATLPFAQSACSFAAQDSVVSTAPIVYTAEDQRAAMQLNAKGDLAYKKNDYRSAYTAYSNSYPNYPNAYAYLMAGDSHWRALVKFHTESAAKSPQNGAAEPSESCSLPNTHFVHDTESELARDHDFGLKLADNQKDQKLLNSELYRRARETAECLHALAKDYASKSPQTCVDIAKIQQCIGPPLIQ